MSQELINTNILDSIIIGRVEPHIYAFYTQTVPNYLKVGDTYRPVDTRLKEWRNAFPDLKHIYTHSARIDDDTLFRDYAVHSFLEDIKSRHRLQPNDIPNITYYSNEFFENATSEDIDEAIADIHQSAKMNDGRYQLYSSNHLPKTFTYKRDKCLVPRKNQQEVIDNFKRALKKGRKNLLMYAVMRFGKSFTSMCCAKEMDARLVLVVSAKADVKDEWKKTVESIGNFEGYFFADKKELLSDKAYLHNSLKKGNNIVLFLTLQDLQGERMKKVHEEVFSRCWDLLIVDETHFGARAEQYGRILASKKEANEEFRRQMKDVDTLDNLDDVVKELKTNVTIHLSGTPYRILMGSEFQKDDIIAFVQFSDIADAQAEWDKEHEFDDDSPEWDNPYFGFPQMIRFAFNPNQSSLDRIAKLKKEGASLSFSELFRPYSLSAKEGFNKFIHEDVVVDFLKVIDGVKNDSNVLGFLDNERIKAGKMCRHIVMVLPFCASCDAMELLIKENSDSFRNLSDYEVINISGVKRDKCFNDTVNVKQYIAKCEYEGKRTITLTVNRMLTGNTVPQWDTMLFLKQTSSPEEYDQAIYRLQNPYIDEYEDKGNVIKFNLKPQTVLVDFDPERMFSLQERKSQIYNVNTDNNGNSRLKERIATELRISPIITLDHNKLREVTASNILDAVRNYSETRSILDEASDMPIDMSLLDNPNLRSVVDTLNEIDSKKGLSTPAYKRNDEQDEDDIDSKVSGETSSTATSKTEDKNDDENNLAKKLSSYFALILFFSFLTDDTVISLEDIIKVIDSNENNRRIAKNLGLSIDILKIIQTQSNGFTLSKLDYKIQNTNSLNNDDTKEPLERVKTALTKFGRMSASEIVTPQRIAQVMVNILPDDIFSRGPIIDIASKQGEFTIALIDRFGQSIRSKIYSICTSKLAYEFTRKVYQLLEIPMHNIFDSFTSYDLIGEDKNKILSILQNMNLGSFIGNPPYMEMNKGNGNGSNPIYNHFIDVVPEISGYGVLIHPSRFLFNVGKTPKEWNNKILSNPNINVKNYWTNCSEVFDNVDVTGGIATTLYDSKEEIGPIGTFSAFNEIRGILNKVKFDTKSSFSNIVYPRDLYKLTENSYIENPVIEGRHSKGHRYDLGSSAFEVYPELFLTQKPLEGDYLAIFGKGKNGREYRWIKKEYVKTPDNTSFYKVMIPKSNGSGAIGEGDSTPVVGIPVVGEPGTGHTLTFLSIGKFENSNQALACLKYIKTKFVRLLLGSLKVTQDNPRETWVNVPMQDFSDNSDIDWAQSVENIDKQLYKKYGLSDDEIQFVESMIKPMQ